MKVHQALARGLADLGVEQLFGLIGDANLYLVDSYMRDCGGHYRAGRACRSASAWPRSRTGRR